MIVEFKLRRPGFDRRSVHFVSVIDKLSLEYNFLQALLFPPVSVIPPMLHTRLHGTCCSYEKDERMKAGDLLEGTLGKRVISLVV